MVCKVSAAAAYTIGQSDLKHDPGGETGIMAGSNPVDRIDGICLVTGRKCRLSGGTGTKPGVMALMRIGIDTSCWCARREFMRDPA